VQKNFYGLLIPLAVLLAFLPSDSFAFRYRTPEKSDPLLVKARTLLAHEDIDEALKEFRKLIKQEPRNSNAYLGIADCLYYQSEYLNAMEAVNTAISLNPKSSDAHRRRGKINERLHQDDAALEDYTRAITISPTTSIYLSDRADVYKRKEEYAKAIADLDKYLKLVKKPNPMIYYSRSILYTKMGKKAEADAERKRGDLVINGNY
jgi:tetratricopeptide (TPR) repeat protein